jgi:hypothetical protein
VIAQETADQMAVCKCAMLGVTSQTEIIGAIRREIREQIRVGEVFIAVRGDSMMAPTHN